MLLYSIEALGHETDVQVLEAGIIGSYVSESVSEIGTDCLNLAS